MNKKYFFNNLLIRINRTEISFHQNTRKYHTINRNAGEKIETNYDKCEAECAATHPSLSNAVKHASMANRP